VQRDIRRMVIRAAAGSAEQEIVDLACSEAKPDSSLSRKNRPKLLRFP